MKAIVPSYRTGLRSAALAAANASASGPCGSMQLCRLNPPGTKPCGLAS